MGGFAPGTEIFDGRFGHGARAIFYVDRRITEALGRTTHRVPERHPGATRPALTA